MTENTYDDIMKLLNRSDQIALRIMDPTEDDIKLIKKLYDSGIIISRTSTIIYGVPRKRVVVNMVLDKRLEDIKWNISIF